MRESDAAANFQSILQAGARCIIAFLLIAPLISPVHAAGKLPAGFSAPRDEIIEKIKRVALLPVDIGGQWPRAIAATSELEAYLTQKLEAAGISVTPVSTYQEAELRVRTREGGWYDPQSGRPIEAKRTTILEQTRAELVAEHALDGFVKVRVDVVGASFNMTGAQWHGVREPSRFPLGQNGLLRLLDNSVGELPALSVAVIVLDANFKDLYGRYGGLQLLSMVRETKGVTDFPDVDPQFVLSDPVRNRRAVRLALDPLLLSAQDARAQEADFRKRRAEAVKSARKGSILDDDGSLMADPVIEESPVATAGPPPALRVDPAELSRRVATITLSPVVVDIGRRLPGRDAFIEQSLTRGLTESGYRVIPSSIFAETFAKHEATMGPYFDSITGDRLDDRLNALNAAVAQELRDQHGVDAIVHSSVRRTSALHDGKRASWDGVSQPLAQNGGAMARFNAATSTGYAGSVPAVSISSRMVHVDGVELFAKRSGVQLLQRMSGGMLTKLVDVEDKDLLDPEALDIAADLLVEELRVSAKPVE